MAKDTIKTATVSDSNYATKAMSEFTVMNGDELKNMEEIMKMVKNKMAMKGRL